MSLWITLVIIAQFVNAIVAMIDKYIVTSGKISRPVNLAFMVSVLSVLSIGLFLFSWIPLPIAGLAIPSFANVSAPSVLVVVYSFLGAIAFIGALIGLFTALRDADASDVVPVVSSMNALGTLILSFYVLDGALHQNFMWGVSFLIVGMFLLSRFRLSKKTFWISIIAGLAFAVHYVFIKLLFSVTVFDDAFFWSRILIVITAFGLLLLPFYSRQRQQHGLSKTKKAGYAWVIGNKVLAGLASIMLLKAIELGDVTVVQSLAGIQFIFLIVIAVVVNRKLSYVCGENCQLHDWVQKIVSIAIIVTGFSLLFL